MDSQNNRDGKAPQLNPNLTPEQIYVLRHEGTERPGSSPLNDEKRPGTYYCAGCGAPLFTSATKYDSGSGWPSFYAPIEGSVETKVDYKLLIPRTEYHCARCGGHQGHVFNDGPEPTGLRYCNNGVALTFVPDSPEEGDAAER
jgi:peptide-methionine (R)-S-oxide reductase